MACRMGMNVSANVARTTMPTGAGACSMAYGPVANVCQSAMPVTQMVPITTVTPVPNMVQPQMQVAQPMGMAPWGKGAGMAPWMQINPMGAIPGIGSMSMANTPWGKNTMTTTGVVPGIYTTDVAMPMVW